MIRRVAIVSLEVVAILVGLTAGGAAYLAWRLSEGPLPVSIVNFTIEDAINEALPGGHLSIRDTVLDWSAADRTLTFRLSEISLTGEAGNPIATVPEMDVQLSVPALLKGMIAATTVDLYGVTLRLERTAEGGVSFGLQTPASDTRPPQLAPSFVGPLVEALAEPPDLGTPLGYFRRLRIRDGKVVYVERVNQFELLAEEADITLRRGARGVYGEMSTSVPYHKGAADLQLQGRLPYGSDTLELKASLKNGNPAGFSKVADVFAAYGPFDVDIDAEATMTVDRLGSVRQATLDVEAGEGAVYLPDLRSEPVKLDRARVQLDLDVQKETLAVNELTFAAEGNSARITGDISYEPGAGLWISKADADLVAEAPVIDVPGFFEGPIRLDRVAVAGVFDVADRRADISNFDLAMGEARLRLASAKFADMDGVPSIALDGEIENFSLGQLLTLWPVDMAEGARSWIARSMAGGVLPQGTIQVEASAQDMRQAQKGNGLPNEAVLIAFELQDTDVTYIPGMPPIRNAAGWGKLQGNRFEAGVTQGVVTFDGDREVELVQGDFVTEPLNRRAAPGTIVGQVKGKTADMLVLLNQDPLNLLASFDFDPATVGGTTQAQATLKMPLIKDLTPAMIDIKAHADAQGVVVPNFVGDVDIDGGTLAIDVTQNQLVASGDVDVLDTAATVRWLETFQPKAGEPQSVYDIATDIEAHELTRFGITTAPFLTGPLEVEAHLEQRGGKLDMARVNLDLSDATVTLKDVEWTKAKGERLTGRVDLAQSDDGVWAINTLDFKGDDVSVEGSARFSETAGLLKAELTKVQIGQAYDFSFIADRKPADENGRVTESYTAVGSVFDMRPILDHLWKGRYNGLGREDRKITAGTIERFIRFDFARLLMKDDLTWHHLEAEARIGPDLPEIFRLVGVDDNDVPFKARLLETKQGERTLNVSSWDAGALARAVGLAQGIKGGTLNVDATLGDEELLTGFNGKMRVENFRVVDAPILAQILTLGSLTGIVDTLGGEGIKFTALDLPLSISENRITIEDSRLYGPAVGLTARGQIDRETYFLDLDGTLVPAYTLNTLFSGVPILGPILTGREGEGIFGLTFEVDGEPHKAKVKVNPLSALAPGFLRRLFEFGSNLPPESDRPAKAPPAPPAG